MDHQDALISSIVIVLDPSVVDANLDAFIAELKSVGLSVDTVNPDLGMVEGEIESAKLHPLEKTPGVKFVRTVYTYVADYPTGDSRDTDTDPNTDTDAA